VRILVVAQDFPWPVVTGSMIRLTNVIESLARLGRVDLFCFLHEERTDPCVAPADAPLGRVATAVYREKGFGPAARVRWLFSSSTIQTASRDHDDVRAAFAQWAEDRYDLVWFSKAHTYAVLGGPRLGPTIVDLDDLEDRKILAQLEARRRDRGGRHAVREALANVQARLDARRWSRLQHRIALAARAVVVCSELDAERLGVRNASVVPNGYPRPDVPLGRASVGSRPTVLFAGLLYYPPNSDAARWLVQGILPHLLRRVPDVRLRLVGAPEPRIAALDTNPAVTVVGRVPSMDPELQRADLVVVPVRFGSGTRVKILEAFAHRIPVVSTTLGAEGLHAVDGRELLLADSAEDFADAVARLLTDEDLRSRLVRSAEALFRGRHMWSHSGEAVLQLAAQHLAERAGEVS
jgi:glycosyltransferase involved in cell wall biosynthesis